MILRIYDTDASNNSEPYIVKTIEMKSDDTIYDCVHDLENEDDSFILYDHKRNSLILGYIDYISYEGKIVWNADPYILTASQYEFSFPRIEEYAVIKVPSGIGCDGGFISSIEQIFDFLNHMMTTYPAQTLLLTAIFKKVGIECYSVIKDICLSISNNGGDFDRFKNIIYTRNEWTNDEVSKLLELKDGVALKLLMLACLYDYDYGDKKFKRFNFLK